MEDQTSTVPVTRNILVHTGNIVNWNLLKKKVTQNPTEELTECIDSSLERWTKSQEKTSERQSATDVECLNSQFIQKLTDKERADIKLTVKLFLTTTDKESVHEAIDKVLGELGTSYIENLLICLPEADLTAMRAVWQVLEECVNSGRVLSLGVSDLSKPQLEELYNWAKVKPTVAQVNLSTCCVVPTDMQEFAKQNSIQLLTHNDPTHILPVERFQEILKKRLVTGSDGETWMPTWVVRYSALIKRRGIIKSKGYILRAETGSKGSK